jgi:hypothetical protein
VNVDARFLVILRGRVFYLEDWLVAKRGGRGMHRFILQKKTTISRIIPCLLLISFFIQSDIAFAQHFRCSGRIIKTGLSKNYVLEKCGEPARTEAFSDPTPWGAKTGELLYYERHGKTVIIEFRRGEVKRIRMERK